MKTKLKMLWSTLQAIASIILVIYSVYIGLIGRDFAQGCYFISFVLLDIMAIRIRQD